MAYPLQNTIAVDVDGTLLVKGNPNNNLIEFIRNNQNNYKFILWSMAGEQHAREVAEQFNITELFQVIISKPGYIIDDMGWGWVKQTKCLNNLVVNQ